MSKFIIYRDGELALSSGIREVESEFEPDFEESRYYGLIIALLGKDDCFSKKLLKQKPFIVDQEEKRKVSEALEQYIDERILSFRQATEEDVYIKIEYKGTLYRANIKRVKYRNDKNLVCVMSLYVMFYDPENMYYTEIVFDKNNRV